MCEASETQQCVYLVKNGFGSWDRVLKIPEMERHAAFYTARMQDGCTVDWNTGEIRPPK